MPLLTTSTRRALLRSAGAGMVAFLGRGAAAESTHWALLSDIHIPADPKNEYRGFLPQENLRKVVPQVAEKKPDGVIICGDLARLEGLPADYEAVKSLLTPLHAVPTGMCLGNHDDRKNFFSVMGTPASGRPQPVKGKHVVVIDGLPVRLILLDSLMAVNFVPGLLGKAQRGWLDEYLTTSDETPTVIFVHHTLDDSDGSLLDAERLLRAAGRHRKVKALIYGHSHRYAYDTYEGIHLVNLPAVGYNFQDSEPVGWVEANLSPAGGDFRLTAIGGNTAKNGKTVSLSWRS